MPRARRLLWRSTLAQDRSIGHQLLHVMTEAQRCATDQDEPDGVPKTNITLATVIEPDFGIVERMDKVGRSGEYLLRSQGKLTDCVVQPMHDEGQWGVHSLVEL